jgi:chromosome segregation ATPase
MDPQWKTYHYRMQSLEKDLAGHDSRFNEFGARNDTHSAKLRTLERQLEDLKFDNSRLYNEVASLRSDEFLPVVYVLNDLGNNLMRKV